MGKNFKIATGLRQRLAKIWRIRTARIMLLCIPILIFHIPVLISGQKVLLGDADYYFQTYEAFRRTVIEFHQFPWNNAWIGGNIPLFANIQFGLVSLSTPLVLVFGTVLGLKISFIVYSLIGFFGFRKLVAQVFNTPPLKSVLLAYIWVFSTFFAHRLVGHFTFSLFQFAPWVLLLYYRRAEGRNWLWLALVFSLMVWSSPHYATIMCFLCVAIFLMVEKAWLWVTTKKVSITKPGLYRWFKIGTIIAALTAFRMYHVLRFVMDYPRPGDLSPDPYFGIWRGLQALFSPYQFDSPLTPEHPVWLWIEGSNYIGITTGVAALIIVAVWLYPIKRRSKTQIFFKSPGPLLLLFAIFFVLGLGRFHMLSPFNILQQVPGLSFLRVSSRWFMWCSVVVLLLIANYRSKLFSRTITVLLVISTVNLFAVSSFYLYAKFNFEANGAFTPTQYRRSSEPFAQGYFYRANRGGDLSDQNMYEATKNNYGQLIANDSLVNTWGIKMKQCGFNTSECQLVLSQNAHVEYWSPNKIVLVRSGPGDIKINMSPGRDWYVNRQRIFSNYKLTDPTKEFIVPQHIHGSARYILEYAPPLSFSWLRIQLLN